jgi:SulP family sulfate permease
LSASGVTLIFSGIKRQVLQVMERAGLYALIGAQHFFRNEESALEAIDQWVNDASFEARYCSASPAQDSQSGVQAPQLGSPTSR